MTQSPQPPQPSFGACGNSDYRQGRINLGHRHGTASDGGNDRRRKRRSLISAPIRIRSLNTAAAGPDEICTTLDVSRNGILFVSPNQMFHRGMEVAVIFPYTKCPGILAPEQPGSVVRVSALSDGKVAVAIGFASGINNKSADGAATPNLDHVSKSLADGDSRGRPLILVVEADSRLRDLLKGFLTAEGYKVIAVDNASDAREVLNMLTPSLLIAEIEGEGLPGFDLCVHVKMTPRLKHIPVMLTTESAYPSDYSSAHSLGAVVCLAKPFRQERFGHVVRLLVPPAQAATQATPPRAPDPTRGLRRHRGSNRR
ncbi:MAG: response regulator [Candidatus Acidiferrales bacterium]